MKNISLFLALKYFRSRGSGFVSFHSGMAILGIAIGLIVLILVTSVMNGFQRELKDRILETIPHASILGNIELEEFSFIEKDFNVSVMSLSHVTHRDFWGLHVFLYNTFLLFAHNFMTRNFPDFQ